VLGTPQRGDDHVLSTVPVPVPPPIPITGKLTPARAREEDRMNRNDAGPSLDSLKAHLVLNTKATIEAWRGCTN
jgi:hypothetical protein